MQISQNEDLKNAIEELSQTISEVDIINNQLNMVEQLLQEQATKIKKSSSIIKKERIFFAATFGAGLISCFIPEARIFGLGAMGFSVIGFSISL